MILDVNSVNFSENIILNNIVHAFAWLELYTNHFLYFFISFEIIVCGLSWALYQNQLLERLLFQLLKIGLIIFVIHHYGSILNGLLSTALMFGQHFSLQADPKVLFNPGLIWQYGYNNGIYLLQAASTMGGLALPLLLISLGMGILLVFGIFGIQICLQVLSFYFVSTLSLITIPLACFQQLDSFLSRSVQNVLQATIRLIVQLCLVFSAMHIWSVSSGKVGTSDINFYLGLLFSGLLFVMASFYLPFLAAKIVGEIRGGIVPMAQPQWVTTGYSPSSIHSSSVQNVLSSSTSSHAYSTEKVTLFSAPPIAYSQYLPAVQSSFLKASSQTDISSIEKKYISDIESQRLKEIKEIKETFIQIFNDNYQDRTD